MEAFTSNTKKVTLEHESGMRFVCFLTDYELDKATTDANFKNELIEKYYKLHTNGVIYGQKSNTGDTNNSTTTSSFSDRGSEEDKENNKDSDRYLWSRSAVLLLLEELFKVKDALLLPHKKRKLFSDICQILINHGYIVRWETCERKWRGLQAMYKKIKQDLNRSGNGAVTWEFFDKVDNILARDPAYNPATTAAFGISEEMTCNEEQEMNPKKRKREEKEWFETQFKAINKNITEVKETMAEFVNIQRERNSIFDRVAASLEKLANK